MSDNVYNAVGTIAAVVIIIVVWWQVMVAARTHRGQVYIQMSNRYASEEIHKSILLLRDWWANAGPDFVERWVTALRAGGDEAGQVDAARRSVAIYFFDLLLLYELRILDAPLARALVRGYGSKVYAQICLPLGEPLYGEMESLITRFRKLDPSFGKGEL